MKLSSKITLSILLLIVVTGLLIGSVCLRKYKTSVTNESYFNLKHLVESHGKDFDSHIKFIEQYTLILYSITESTLPFGDKITEKQFHDYEKKIIPQLKSFASQLQPMSYWIVFNPDYIKGGHTISFLDKNGSGNYIRQKEYCVCNRNLDAEDMRWWTNALKKSSTWTNRYYWDIWDKFIVTYSKGVYDGNKLCAVVGSDIDFNTLKKDIEKLKIYKTGHFSILNDKFEFVYHPKYFKKSIQDIENGSLAFIKDSIKNSKFSSGIIEYPINKGDHVLGYYKLHNGWTLCVGIPKNEIFEELRKSVEFLILVITLGILMAITLGHFLSRTISKPIDELTKVIRIAATGNLNIHTNFNSNDEFKELGIYFNYFLEKLEHTIKELKENEKILIEAKNKAEESEQLKTSFLNNMSHEIRTPMNAIIGLVGLLQENILTEDERLNYIYQINISCNNLLSLIDDVLDISKIEIGTFKLNYTKEEIKIFLKEINYFCKQEIENSNNRKSVSFISSIDQEVLSLNIYLDKIRIKQVINNLIKNAIKFTKSGSITFGCRKYVNNQLLFFVKDTGIGISNQYHMAIFEKFRKVEEENQELFQGVGLGLAIVKEIIILLNGEIWVESELGKGATFYFTIPILEI